MNAIGNSHMKPNNAIGKALKATNKYRLMFVTFSDVNRVRSSQGSALLHLGFDVRRRWRQEYEIEGVSTVRMIYSVPNGLQEVVSIPTPFQVL